MMNRASQSFPWAIVIRAGELAVICRRVVNAALWLDQLLARLPWIELTLLIGKYAQRHFLGSRRKPSLAETAKAWREYAPQFIPLPHPLPRNQPWFKHHPWFERQLVPVLRARTKALVRALTRGLEK
jgi:uracil-DNA glycosylase